IGCGTAPDQLACLRSKTPTELLEVIVPDETATSGAAYGPSVDGYVLPNDILDAFKSGKQNNVPLMIGTNKDEGTLFIQDIPLTNEADYESAVRDAFRELGDAVLAKYPLSDYGGSPKAALDALVSDFLFRCPARPTSQLVAASQLKVYVYQFTYITPLMPDLGSFHGLELPFVFNSPSIIAVADKKQI